eukprot:2557822-Pyramimonas_sp.AAC.1
MSARSLSTPTSSSNTVPRTRSGARRRRWASQARADLTHPFQKNETETATTGPEEAYLAVAGGRSARWAGTNRRRGERIYP